MALLNAYYINVIRALVGAAKRPVIMGVANFPTDGKTDIFEFIFNINIKIINFNQIFHKKVKF